MYAIFCVSCKKDEDNSAPRISVVNPQENITLNTFDTLYVQANLLDDRNLTFVSVELLNADLISVVSPYGRNLNSSSYFLNAQLIIDNIHLISGIHYILITAKDQVNTTRSYIKVFVNGLPLETKGYVSFENVGNQIEIHSYFNQNDTLLLQTNGEVKGGIVDSYHQQLGILKGPDGPFQCFPLYPFIEEWEVAETNGGITFCRNQIENNFIQLGFNDQLLSFYEGEAQLQGSFQSDISYSPMLSLKNGENIIVWQHAPSQSANRLEVFYPSGAIKQVSPYNRTVVAFEIKNDNQVYVISNEATSAYLDIYNLENGIINSQSFENEHFYDACQDDIGNIYIAGLNGIKKYNPTTLQLNNFSPEVASQVCWDLNQQRLAACTGNEIIVMNLLGQEVYRSTLSGNCKELTVWYSK
jgi:hypothetical protein